MSYFDRENVRKVKRQEPSVISSALGAAVVGGVLGSVVADVVDFSTPDIAVALSQTIGDGSAVIKPEVIQAGVQDMLANPDVLKLGSHGIELVDKTVMPNWGVMTFQPDMQSDAAQMLEAAGKKIVYHPDMLQGMADVDTVTRAVQLRDALDTLHNHDGQAIGRFVVGNMIGQGTGATIGLLHGVHAHNSWSQKLQTERAKLDTIDKLLM